MLFAGNCNFVDFEYNENFYEPQQDKMTLALPETKIVMQFCMLLFHSIFRFPVKKLNRL